MKNDKYGLTAPANFVLPKGVFLFALIKGAVACLEKKPLTQNPYFKISKGNSRAFYGAWLLGWAGFSDGTLKLKKRSLKPLQELIVENREDRCPQCGQELTVFPWNTKGDIKICNNALCARFRSPAGWVSNQRLNMRAVLEAVTRC